MAMGVSSQRGKPNLHIVALAESFTACASPGCWRREGKTNARRNHGARCEACNPTTIMDARSMSAPPCPRVRLTPEPACPGASEGRRTGQAGRLPLKHIYIYIYLYKRVYSLVIAISNIRNITNIHIYIYIHKCVYIAIIAISNIAMIYTCNNSILQ